MNGAELKSKRVYISCLVTGIILIAAFVYFSIYDAALSANKDLNLIYALTCVAPLIAGVLLMNANLGGFLVVAVTVAHVILLVWVLILFFKARPSELDALVIVNWVWTCVSLIVAIIAIVIFVFLMIGNKNKKDEHHHYYH